MADVDVFLPVGSQPTLDDFVEQAVTAEKFGYDRAWFPESWGRDAVTMIATVAEQTERIDLGTSIALLLGFNTDFGVICVQVVQITVRLQ
jgi:alkanesulfonate monooxygenase SsuD/methylene tetrahydromethanopterin reductase-like flavin-dependent oxidoreductase (luciferase family)